MRSTKIKLAIVLGLTSAAALGLVMVSSSVEAEAETIKLTMIADETFAASNSTLQLKENGVTVTNFSTGESTYTRTVGKGYTLNIKAATPIYCKFVSGDMTGDKAIDGHTPEITKVYLTMEGSLCNMDTVPFGGKNQINLNVYAKTGGATTQLIVHEFENNVAQPNPESYAVSESWEAGKPYTHPNGSNINSLKLTVKASKGGSSTYDFNCAFKSGTQEIKNYKPLNVTIDAAAEKCTLTQSETEIILTDLVNSPNGYTNGSQLDFYFDIKATNECWSGRTQLVIDDLADGSGGYKYSVARKGGECDIAPLYVNIVHYPITAPCRYDRNVYTDENLQVSSETQQINLTGSALSNSVICDMKIVE